MRNTIIYIKENEINEKKLQIKKLQEEITHLRRYRKCAYCKNDFYASESANTIYCSMECKVRNTIEQQMKAKEK